MAASRERRKEARLALRIEVSHEIADVLTEARLLAEWDSENPVMIAKAIERLLAAMITNAQAEQAGRQS
jgi:hypothetical protein